MADQPVDDLDFPAPPPEPAVVTAGATRVETTEVARRDDMPIVLTFLLGLLVLMVVCPALVAVVITVNNPDQLFFFSGIFVWLGGFLAQYAVTPAGQVMPAPIGAMGFVVILLVFILGIIIGSIRGRGSRKQKKVTTEKASRPPVVHYDPPEEGTI